MSKGMPSRTSEYMLENTPSTVSEGMSDRMSEDMPDKMSEVCQRECQKYQIQGQKVCRIEH